MRYLIISVIAATTLVSLPLTRILADESPDQNQQPAGRTQTQSKVEKDIPEINLLDAMARKLFPPRPKE